MIQRIHLSLLLLLSSFIVNAQQPDVPINPNMTWNGEISLAQNPTVAGNLVVGWMKLTSIGQVSIGICRSYDNGNTWSDPTYMPHFSPTFTSADPSLIFGDDGTAYLAYIDYKTPSMDSGSVYVSKSQDGGATWSQPMKAIDVSVSPDLGIDRPWLAIDESNGNFDGRLYLVTKGANDAPLPHHLYLTYSTDGGITWSNAKQIDQSIPVGPQSNSMGVPTVTAEGKLCVAYFSYDPASSPFARNIITSSSDGGSTFSSNVIDILPSASMIPPADSLLQFSYYLGAHPSFGSNLVFIYTDRRNGDWDILSTSSFDGGQTWSQAIRINDDPIANGVYQDMCWGGFSPDGKFVSLWRDRREANGGQTSPYKIYGAWSSNGGAAYQPNFDLSASAGSLATPIKGNDFLGTAMSDSTIVGAWADKRGISNQIYFNSHPTGSTAGIYDAADSTMERFLPEVVSTDCVDLPHGNTPGSPIPSVQIYNVEWRLVMQFTETQTICFQELNDGCYFFLLKDGGITKFQRVILSR